MLHPDGKAEGLVRLLNDHRICSATVTDEERFLASMASDSDLFSSLGAVRTRR